MICAASSGSGVKAVCDHIEKTLGEKKIQLLNREGLSKKTWALLGTADVAVNVFDKKARRFYNLEGLWADSPRIDGELISGGEGK